MSDLLIQQFEAALKDLVTPLVTVESPAEAVAAVLDALHRREVTEVVAWADPLLDAIGLPGAARQAGVAWVAATPDADPTELRATAARAGAGVTGADFAVAETGTLALLSGPGKPRMVSLLPPLHIAVVRRERLLANQAALCKELVRLAAAGETPSSVNLITGPSRTADIEHILVRKVHGPGELLVILM
ncbi:MAG TPA: lactate utilization protein [Symbiobacteriaceae bacterium]|nr:lactate utilization protein [Symbiobacteriaceae bacterium]